MLPQTPGFRIPERPIVPPLHTQPLFVALLLTSRIAAIAAEDPVRAVPPAGPRVESDPAAQKNGVLVAGASAVDISPRTLPVRRNGGFIEATATRIADPLHARALVLADGRTRIALVVVDSCMLPRTLCDEVKELVEQSTGIRRDRVMISATHTHSAPSAMDYCLGSRADPEYTRTLAPRIARAVVEAKNRERPAELGYTLVDAPEHTACRRWIRRTDRVAVDPFGEKSIRANMHPGYQNPEFTGPSGPIDPGLSVLSVRGVDGRPIALLANYSMHYFGVGGDISPDWFGLFARMAAQRVAPEDSEFVAILSQGTSGDLWRGDYSRPKRDVSIDAYTEEVLDLVLTASADIRWERQPVLALEEERLTLARRVPDAARLEWARKTLPDATQLPRTRPEVYASQAFYLDRAREEEIVLQALRIGGLGLTAVPCEVYALTGLELKARSPLQPTFNFSLANGAAGYIPPPEQHALGGYTTWPSRTAGLEVEAEPKIVESVLELLEKASGETRRTPRALSGSYARQVLDSDPLAYWRLEEFRGPQLADASRSERHATLHPRAAFWLPGPSSSAFSREDRNRAVHLAGGWLASQNLPSLKSWTVSFWIWQGIIGRDRSDLGRLIDLDARVLRLVSKPDTEMAWIAAGDASGKTPIAPRTWHHVAVTRSDDRLRVFLDGRPELERVIAAGAPKESTLRVGGGPDAAFGLEGRLDEVAVWSRALSPDEIQSQLDTAAPAGSDEGDTGRHGPGRGPLSPEETIARTMVREGYRIELVAAEPEVRDPVAIDWGAEGQLWVVEMADYPGGKSDKEKNATRGGGRVVSLADGDGDGHFEQSTLFAEGLSFPTGVLDWHGGILVTAAPDILFLADTDGDGRADHRETLFTGFLPGNQQLRTNGLRYGLDNWVWCASGGHHAGYGAGREVRSTQTGEAVALGSRDFRLHPTTHRLDPQSGPSQFGRVRDDYGNWFGVQNSRPLWHWVLEDPYCRRNPHVAARDAKQLLLEVNPRLWPVKSPQKRYHSYEHRARFTSACGPSIYRDEVLFGADDRVHAFTCDPFHSLVQHLVLERDGVTFRARPDTGPGERDFFASADRWCRPVMTRTGPDGALWVVDMYRYLIEHPEWLPEVGRRELRGLFREGEDRGRIYRIVPDTLPPANAIVAEWRVTEDPVQHLRSDNGTVRDLAQKHIVQSKSLHHAPSIERRIERLLEESPRAAVRLQALATLDGLGVLTERHLSRALADRSPWVVRWAIRLAERFASVDSVVDAVTAHTAHEDPSVRLQLAQSLGAWSDARAGAALAELARAEADDEWMRAAILAAAVPHQTALARAVAASPVGVRAALTVPLIDTALGSGRVDCAEILCLPLLERSEDDLSPRLFLALGRVLDRFATSRKRGGGSEEARTRLANLDARAARVQSLAREICREPGADASLVAAAAGLLGREPGKVEADRALLESLLEPGLPGPLQRAALARSRQMGTRPAAILEHFETYLPEMRAAAFGSILAQNEWTEALLASIERAEIDAAGLTALERQQLTSHRDKAVAQHARQLLADRAAGDRRALLRACRPALRLNGDAARGARVFDARCAACHAIDGVGPIIGPDLRALSDRSREALLEAILDPNASIEPRYLGYSALLKSGEAVNGLVVGESGNGLTLQLADGSRREILHGDLSHLASSGRSFMPEGLEKGLRLGDLADLLRFLQSL